MRLKEWLQLKGFSVPRFCKYNDFCQESVYSYFKGKVPRGYIAMQIVKATQGEVTLEDLGVSANVIVKIQLKVQKAREKREQARARKAAKLQESHSDRGLQLTSGDVDS
jgi:hypothetical protein